MSVAFDLDTYRAERARQLERENERLIAERVRLERLPVAESAFHCIPVRKTSRIAFIARRSGTRGL